MQYANMQPRLVASTEAQSQILSDVAAAVADSIHLRAGLACDPDSVCFDGFGAEHDEVARQPGRYRPAVQRIVIPVRDENGNAALAQFLLRAEIAIAP